MFGISNLSSIPVRTEPKETSEMCTQLLFGEHYEIIEQEEKWSKIRIKFDNYEGWIDNKVILPISEEEFLIIDRQKKYITSDIFNIVQHKNHYSNFLIVGGSTLPHFNPENQSFRIKETQYKLQGTGISAPSEIDTRTRIIDAALKYFNAPYQWGGRTPLGIDCSGFTQIVYKIAGIPIPRDASQQAQIGQHFSFIEEALPGDLAFFDDNEGNITHVGIFWEKNKIIHSSGQVRIDNMDHQGIYNIETKRYTHQCRMMKKILPSD